MDGLRFIKLFSDEFWVCVAVKVFTLSLALSLREGERISSWRVDEVALRKQFLSAHLKSKHR